jgi:hypothetical protein
MCTLCPHHHGTFVCNQPCSNFSSLLSLSKLLTEGSMVARPHHTVFKQDHLHGTVRLILVDTYCAQCPTGRPYPSPTAEDSSSKTLRVAAPVLCRNTGFKGNHDRRQHSLNITRLLVPSRNTMILAVPGVTYAVLADLNGC